MVRYNSQTLEKTNLPKIVSIEGLDKKKPSELQIKTGASSVTKEPKKINRVGVLQLSQDSREIDMVVPASLSTLKELKDDNYEFIRDKRKEQQKE